MFSSDATLAFDWNTGAIGVLDAYSEQYRCYPFGEMEDAAKLILDHTGVLVSFNVNAKDLMELRKLAGDRDRLIAGVHVDMLDETSKIRWPPKPGTHPINGTGLDDTYKFFGGPEYPPEPIVFESGYYRKVWFDCYRAAYLYRAWVENMLTIRGLSA